MLTRLHRILQPQHENQQMIWYLYLSLCCILPCPPSWSLFRSSSIRWCGLWSGISWWYSCNIWIVDALGRHIQNYFRISLINSGNRPGSTFCIQDQFNWINWEIWSVLPHLTSYLNIRVPVWTDSHTQWFKVFWRGDQMMICVSQISNGEVIGRLSVHFLNKFMSQFLERKSVYRVFSFAILRFTPIFQKWEEAWDWLLQNNGLPNENPQNRWRRRCPVWPALSNFSFESFACDGSLQWESHQQNEAAPSKWPESDGLFTLPLCHFANLLRGTKPKIRFRTV
jgi:hypothetical protein